LPYIVISEIDIRFSVTDVVCTKLMLYGFSYFWFIVFMEISITLKKKKTLSTKLQSFSKTGVIPTSIRVREGW